MNAMSIGALLHEALHVGDVEGVDLHGAALGLGVMPERCSPWLRMYSTCSGHASISVTSWPARVM
jgi:hypothetical protein